jgi:hypothetical protein
MAHSTNSRDDDISNAQSIGDSDDDDFNYIPGSQPRIFTNEIFGSPTKQKRKSSTEDQVKTTTKKSKVTKNIEEFEVLLNNLDKEKDLSIHKFLSDYDTDVLVKEYVDLLFKYNVLPLIPNHDELEKVLSHTPTFELSSETYIALIKNFMSLFQSKYFQNNVLDASVNGIQLFNPIIKFSIPSFQFLPEKTLNEFTELKKSIAIRYQESAHNGSEFTSELFVLRNVNLIMEYIQVNVHDNVSEELVNQDFLFYFASTYYKARTEFLSVFRVKSIDWTTRTGKVRHLIPKWRKDCKPPPIEPFNFYAKKIEIRINEGKESFKGEIVQQKFKDFVTKAEESISNLKAKHNKKKHGNDSSNNVKGIPDISSSNRPSLSAKRRFVKKDKTVQSSNFKDKLNKIN